MPQHRAYRNARPANRELTLCLPARPEAVGRARRAFDGMAAAHGADSLAVRWVVSELVGNAVLHAYPSRRPGPVLVTATAGTGMLVVAVADLGVGMRPGLDAARLGLGLPLTGRLTRELRIRSDASGTVVAAGVEIRATLGGAKQAHGPDAVLDHAMANARTLLAGRPDARPAPHEGHRHPSVVIARIRRILRVACELPLRH
jgi:anti-sigma regulatory factor (Ser/Thr protein kinase)